MSNIFEKRITTLVLAGSIAATLSLASTSASEAADSLTGERSVITNYTSQQFDERFREVNHTRWDGFFVGAFGNIGRVKANARLAESSGSHQATDGGVGVYGGYNFDFDYTVLGIEADYRINLMSGYENTDSNRSIKLDHTGSLRFKLGMPVTEDILGFASVGVAYGKATMDGVDTKGTKPHYGVAASLGADIVVTDNVLARVEARYTGLFEKTYKIDASERKAEFYGLDLIAGLSYKF